MTVADCIARLEDLAPPALAEAWDNTGLLIGDRAAVVTRVLTCLTLTPDVAREALDAQVNLIVTHHPVLFQPVQRLTTETSEGAMLQELIRARIAVYSAHTAYDSASDGINTQIARRLGLVDVVPLRPAAIITAGSGSAAGPLAGGGRHGRLVMPQSLGELTRLVQQALSARGVHYVGDAGRIVTRVAIACGAAAEFLADATRGGCDVLITGEARFHACLEARTSGVALILPGHYATERPAMEQLAERIAGDWPGVEAWASRVETDPLQWWTP